MLTQALLLFMLLAAPDELTDRKRAAGDDVGKLFELAVWCEVESHPDESRALLERVVKLDPEHTAAREKLRHHRYDGRWFETYRDLSAYRKAEEEHMSAKGLSRYGSEWVPAADVPFLRMGWARGADGRFRSPAALERERVAAERTAAGWQQQDLTWVAPEEFERWRSGLYKCGDQWLGQAEADAWHAQLGQWWKLPGERFVAYTTLDRESARWALWWADQTYADLVRAVGVEPAEKPVFVALKSLEQYNAFAAGSAPEQRPAAEASGWSSVHYAFQADSFVDRSGAAPEYVGAGACYWAVADAALKPFGQHSVRHAAALSYLEAVDPSWDAVWTMLSGGAGAGVQTTEFWAEKQLPLWMRYGIASYCERYFRDAHAAADADPWWPRVWALDNLRQQGGLPPLEEIFAFQLDTADPARSGRLISGAGALVSFVLDGDAEKVAEAHARLKAALAGGGDARAAVQELQQALRGHERDLKRYLGL